MGPDIPEDILKNFKINSKSKSFLSWINGKDAGTIDKDGYFIVIVDKKPYRVHRIIMKIINPGINLEDLEIDHIDGVRSNNDPINLRIVTKNTNRKNSAKRSNNKTGYVGVSITNNNGNIYYTATVRLKNKNLKRHFSVKKFGQSLALLMAIEKRKEMIGLLVAAGEEYTDRHIKGE